MTDAVESGDQVLDGADEDPRIAAAELERDYPAEPVCEDRYWHYPDLNWGRQER